MYIFIVAEYHKDNNLHFSEGCKGRGTVNLPYPTMSVDELCALPIKNISSPKAMLFIWVTFPKLIEALKVIAAWGFAYKGLAFDWTKLKGDKPFIGMGRYTRQNNEVCLRADHAMKPKVLNHSVSCVIQSPIREHSRKPDEVRSLLEAMFGDVPKIELFARQEFAGWDCWGNQINHF